MTKAKILVVEDESIVALDIQSQLRSLGYAVPAVVSSGAEAIRKAGETRPDLVLMDIRLKGEMDGVEAAGQIWARFGIPVFYLTAYADEDTLQRAKITGPFGYILKPFEGRELHTTIEMALYRHRSEQALRESEARLRRRAVELEALAHISSTVREAETVEDMLPLILEVATKTVGATWGAIFLVESETGGLVARTCCPPDSGLLGLRYRVGQGITGHVAATGELHVSEDLTGDPLAKPFDCAQDGHRHGDLEHFAVRSNIALPLRTQECTVGVMHVGFQEAHAFTAEEVRLLTSIGDIAANALYRAEVVATLERRVAERTAELAEANERLKELDRRKSKFVSDVSHELRTPITNIKLYLHLLERGTPEESAQYLAVLKGQTGRLACLIKDILDLSRLEQVKAKVEFAPVDLSEVVEQVVAACQPTAESAGLEVFFDNGTKLPPVRGERSQLSQLVTNLVSNAINYTPRGQVQASAFWIAGRAQACLQVQDTGMGIEAEDMPHIFERFYRGKRVGSSDIPGTGLGLAIVKEIVDLHGGAIEVESQVEKGSTFRVWLPLARQERSFYHD